MAIVRVKTARASKLKQKIVIKVMIKATLHLKNQQCQRKDSKRFLGKGIVKSLQISTLQYKKDLSNN